MFNLQYQYPLAFWLLLLLPLLLGIYLLYHLWKRRSVRRAGDVKLIKALSPSHSPSRSHLKFSILLLAFALGCLALANPRKPDQTSTEARRGIDIVLALDVSNSMKATDLEPDRLTRAQQFISKLIDNLQDDRIGLVVFAGNAYAQMPLTFDREAARLYVSAASPGNIKAQGTSISDALQKSDLLFGQESERFRSVILITDGETHDENALETTNTLAEKGIMVNTVGIGSPDGSPILDAAGNPKRDASGQPVISRLNEQILQQIARATNGVYLHLENSDEAVRALQAQYSQIEKKALGDSSLFNYHTYYAWFAVPMLLFLVAETFLPDRKKLKK